MGLCLVDRLVVAAVAGGAASLQVDILGEQFLVDEKAFVKIFRLDRRRRSRSPLALALGHQEGLAELFEDAVIRMAHYTAALHCRCRVPADYQ
jgi:hypothetical protein